MRTILKYKNRKLYDKIAKQYVTLRDISNYVDSNEEFQILDASTNTDLTYETLVKVLSHKLTTTPIKSVSNVVSIIETI